MLQLKSLWRYKRQAKQVRKMDSMPLWKKDKPQILQSIGAIKSKLKVLLKTKDDEFFIEKWIEHHANIVGIENIIVFDNESTNERTLQSYSKYEGLLVVGFDGFHNLIHHVHLFRELYDTLQRSSEYFAFLDTDEFLVSYDHGTIKKDKSILDRITAQPPGGFIPTTWLYNQTGHEHRFKCGIDKTVLNNGLIWGKPIISSTAPIAGSINHNCQIAERKVPVAPIGGFFLLHMAYLSPQQRIRANLNKLAARGFIKSGESIEAVLGKEISNADYNITLYVSEIKSLIGLTEAFASESENLSPGTLGITKNGKVEFSSTLEEQLLERFVSGFSEACLDKLPAPSR